MTKELRKRPFARPLFVWLCGICISVYIPFECAAIGLGCICLSLMFFSHNVQRGKSLYGERWQWGTWYLLLLLALSCGYVYYRLRTNHSFYYADWLEWCQLWQRELLDPIDLLDLPEWKKNVLATLTLGYRQELEGSVRERFSLAGAAHILAVSGFHVGVVYSFLRLCLFPLSDKSKIRYLKAGLLLVSIWLFAAITGLAVSAVRAAWMLSLYLIGVTIRKKRDSYNTWCATAFCMLVYNPFYLFDIGFQLSFLAVLSIFFFYRRIASLFQLRNPFIRIPWDWFVLFWRNVFRFVAGCIAGFLFFYLDHSAGISMDCSCQTGLGLYAFTRADQLADRYILFFCRSDRMCRSGYSGRASFCIYAI